MSNTLGRSLSVLALSTVLGGLILCCALLSWAARVSADETPAGYVDALTGEVTAAQPNQGRRKLAQDDKVYPHDVVGTAPGGAARIVFRDKSVLEIKESSEVALADFVFEEQGAKAMSVKFATGVFRMVTGEIVKANPDGFKVASPLAEIGIRGTDFASRIDGKTELHALFSTGTPIAVTSSGQQRVISQPDFGVDVTASRVSTPRPLTEAEKKLFARLAFTRQMDMNRLQLLRQGTRPLSPPRMGRP